MAGESLQAAGGRWGHPAHPASPLPLDRAIQWTPRRTSEADSSEAPPDLDSYQLFVRREVLTGINRHLTDGERTPRFGFLLGHVFHCPLSDVDYAVADTGVEVPGVFNEHAVMACLGRGWEDVQRQVGEHQGLLLGWYHSHYLLGLRLSEGDLAANQRYFSAPWHGSIVVAPREDGIVGAVFRTRDARKSRGGALGGLLRLRKAPPTGPSSFFELLDWAPPGGPASVASILWTNYEAERETGEPVGALHDPPTAASTMSSPRPPVWEARRHPPRESTRRPRIGSSAGDENDRGPGRAREPGVFAARSKDTGPDRDDEAGRRPDPEEGRDTPPGPRSGSTGEPHRPEPPRAESAGRPVAPGPPSAATTPESQRSSPGAPAGSLREAGGEKTPDHARAPLPLDRAILWTPHGETISELDELPPDKGPYQFYFEQEVLSALRRHVEGSERELRFGFLLGQLFRCPLSGRRYSVADMALPVRDALDEEASGAYLIRSWTEAQSRLGNDSGILLGWYHSHHHLGLAPSQSDLDTNRRYFGAPWQCSVIVVPDPNGSLGGVFRPPGEAATPGAAQPSRFYELLPESPQDSPTPISSVVVWTNYEADRKVRLPGETVGGSGSAGPAGAAASARAPGPSGPPPAPSVARQPEARPETFTMHEGRPGVPLVIPADGYQTGLLPPRSRRIAWPVVALVFVVALAAVMFLLPDAPRAPSRSASPEPVPSRPAAPVDSPVDSPELDQLIEDVGALEIAGDRYGERARDFDSGRITCPLLATGYVAADEAYVRVAATFRTIEGGANSAATSAYERAGRAIAEVNRHFDASGCPRP